MGHLVGKDIYKKLGEKIDNLTVKAPWNDAVYNIFKTLYTQDEAEVIVKMPYVLSSFDRIQKITKIEPTKLRKILEGLCVKGLVMDIWANNTYNYMISPMVIGIFEFTMMRNGANLNSKEWAKLFHQYLHGDGGPLYAENSKDGHKVSFARTLPHEGTILDEDHVEVLDYEKATSLIEASNKFSIGLCSCRHEKHHIDKKKCDIPLDTCTSFGFGADYLIRNNLAKEVSKTEMLEHFARSKEMGLVFNADNVQKNITFICHCCGCCCNILLGISKFGYPNIVVTSNYIAEIDEKLCIGCGKCSKACKIDAIQMVAIEKPKTKKKKDAKINKDFCIGCGVCALVCPTKAMKLIKRDKRVIMPETTFERIILQSLKAGNLQNHIFDNPQSKTQDFMRGFMGGFLKIPSVKKAILSDALRSTFLATMKMGIHLQGKGWITKL
jgi:NAD-dependent dihydropyrimidine dehydrogenase PreA subunit